MKRFAVILLIFALTAGTALAQADTNPRNWAKLSKSWIPAIEADGTYDPSDPKNVPEKLVDTLVAVQKQGITPEYLKRIDASGKTTSQTIFWAVQGQDANTITQRVLATPGAIKTPPHGVKKAKKKKK